MGKPLNGSNMFGSGEARDFPLVERERQIQIATSGNTFSHWLINRRVCAPREEQPNDDRWYTRSTFLFFPKGHLIKLTGQP